MIILGIETSCDETAAALVKYDSRSNSVRLLNNVVASSVEIQQKYGGIVPELAARHQLSSILRVCQTSLEAKKKLMSGTELNNRLTKQSKLIKSIDALAVTIGPGLIGSLLVGVETAKALALAWDKPLIPVNHLLAHFYACWIVDPKEKSPRIPQFPAVGLLVSGGHTDLILMTNHQNYDWLGGTRDDAAGEAFDKIARLLGLEYPGGPAISRLAKEGNPSSYQLPRPMIDQDNLDFSFAGLKTSVLYTLRRKPSLTRRQKADLAASAQEAIVDTLVAKARKALVQTQAKSLIVAGGVAANQRLREKLTALQSRNLLRKKSVKFAGKLSSSWQLYIPPPNLCTDNAAYVATRAAFQCQPLDLAQIQADPSLRL